MIWWVLSPLFAFYEEGASSLCSGNLCELGPDLPAGNGKGLAEAKAEGKAEGKGLARPQRK